MSKSILIVDTPISCDNCPLCILLDLYRCTVNKRYCGDEQGYFTSSTMPTWCPLKEEKDTIPIEWIKLKIDTVLNIYPNGNDETEILCKLLYDWEKENGSD